MPRLLSAPDAPTILVESNGHTLRQFNESPAHLKAILASYGYRSYLIESGRLCPVQPDDFQPVTCVDYLASKRSNCEFERVPGRPLLDLPRARGASRPLSPLASRLGTTLHRQNAHDGRCGDPRLGSGPPGGAVAPSGSEPRDPKRREFDRPSTVEKGLVVPLASGDRGHSTTLALEKPRGQVVGEVDDETRLSPQRFHDDQSSERGELAD